MDKYYTPDISEFHVGFEYETMYLQDYDTWKKEILLEDDAGYFHSIYFGDAVPTEFRVKYLDKEDIESLGWKGQESNSVYFTKDNYRLVHWITSDGRDINIFEKYDGGTQEECLIRKAKVKNKSELIKLLKQLKIE